MDKKQHMDKKGQGLSLNTIVIAVIVLTVLVIIVMIFTGGISIFPKQYNDCVIAGYQCTDKNPSDSKLGCPGNTNPIGTYTCKDEKGNKINNQVCCGQLGVETS